MSRMNEVLAVRVPANLKRKLKVEAQGRLLDPSDIVREALLKYFARMDADKPAKQEGVAA